jgi:hypothetical protein
MAHSRAVTRPLLRHRSPRHLDILTLTTRGTCRVPGGRVLAAAASSSLSSAAGSPIVDSVQRTTEPAFIWAILNVAQVASLLTVLAIQTSLIIEKVQASTSVSSALPGQRVTHIAQVSPPTSVWQPSQVADFQPLLLVVALGASLLFRVFGPRECDPCTGSCCDATCHFSEQLLSGVNACMCHVATPVHACCL